MTEEEIEQKANEYCSKLWNCEKCLEDRCKQFGKCKDYDKTLKAYKDGYKEGQKGKNYFNRFVDVSKENAELKAKLKEYEKKEKLYSYLEGRFVECIQSCTQEEKEKCSMFPEFCEGEHTKFVDIVELLNKKGEIR